MPPKNKVSFAVLQNDEIIADDDVARDLQNKSAYGTKKLKGKVSFSHLEALYLVEKERLAVKNARGENLDFEQLQKRFARRDKSITLRYPVFADLRSKGYTVKTALKFGGDFRVYEKGFKPGETHAKWIVYPVREATKLSWQDFSAKNRVAHSTKKNLLIAVVDEDGDVSYFEVGWVKP